jgi:glycosyltransferase 2 family protein
MKPWMRTLLPIVKIVFSLAILAAVGRFFYRDLLRAGTEGLWQHSVQPGWLVLSGVFYILGLGCSAWFWIRLLKSLGQRPAALPAIRAYYLGHLGKYLPGKAWALVVRAGLAQGAGVKLGVAGVTSLYEVLTTMAAGALLAAVLFAVGASDTSPPGDWSALRRLFTERDPETSPLDRKVLVALSLMMLVIVGLPILPPIFNRLVNRLRSLKNLLARQPASETIDPRRLHIKMIVLMEGLLMTAFGWMLLGASLWAVIQAVIDEPRLMTLAEWCQLSAILSLAYVAGFIVVFMPSGIGVREFFLRVFLLPELSRKWTGEKNSLVIAIWVVLLLRLVWTAAEMVTNAIVYWFPSPKPD